MADYKFNKGQIVFFTPPMHSAAPRGSYEVTQRLPMSDGEFQYRIKSQHEEYERVAKESQLSPI